MNVAIIGSEDPRSVAQAMDYIATLPMGTGIATILERGVSTEAWNYASSAGLTARLFPTRFQAEGTPYTATDYIKRNQDMMPYIDWLVCFHDAATSGREALMAMALSRGKRVLVYTPGESAAWGDEKHRG